MNQSETAEEPRFLYYAFGGGLGHLNRTLAVVRQMAKRGGRHLIATNSPHYQACSRQIADRVCQGNDIQIVDFSGYESMIEIAQLLAVTIEDFLPNVLVVDTFPRGLVGELAPILPLIPFCRKALISRNLPPDYVAEYDLVAFVQQHFDLVVGVETDTPFAILPGFCQVDPILIFSGDEISCLAPANSIEQRSVLIVASGNKIECDRAEQLWRLAQQDARLESVNVQIASPALNSDNAPFHWPLMERLGEFDLVVGWAGYNLHWETRVLGVPSLLLVGDRKYDDQTIRSNEKDLSNDELINRVAQLLENESAQPGDLNYINGAEMAADLISHLSNSG